MSETKTYWRTLKGSHKHTKFHCANKHRSIHSGDCYTVTEAEAANAGLAPCAECCDEEEVKMFRPTQIATIELCANSGVTHPRRIYSHCKDCGKQGKVNTMTGKIKSHKPESK